MSGDDHTGNCARIIELENKHNGLSRKVASWDGITKVYMFTVTGLQFIIAGVLIWLLVTAVETRTDIAVMKEKIDSAKKITSYNQRLLKKEFK